MSYDTDVLVLGSGPGGYTAAFRAADLGKRVTLVERYPSLGGVCLNVGCIPSKALLHLAEALGEIEGLAEKGITVGEPSFDLGKVNAFKSGVVGRLTKGLAGMAKQRGVEVVQGTGKLTGPRELAVEGEGGARKITFESAILAAGSRVSRIPGIPYDDPRVWDSTAALELREIPERLLVIGGGIIGLELATVYDALGAKVTVVELLDRLMTGTDADLVKVLERRIRRRYEAILRRNESGEGRGGRRRADGHAARQRAQGQGAAAGALRRHPGRGRPPAQRRLDRRRRRRREVTERGFIPVDRQQRTNVEHIFAIGDLVEGPMLAHKASHQGKIAAEVAAGEKSAFDVVAVPGGRLHRPRDRVGRAHRGGGRSARPQGRDRHLPLARQRALARAGAHRRHDQARLRPREPPRCSAPASSVRAPATSSPRRRSRSRWAATPTTSRSPSIRIPRCRRR